MIRRPPRSTLFPSPTLSRPDHPGYSCCLTCSRLGAVSGRIHRWRAPAYPPTVRVDPCHREARIRTCRAPGNEESEEHTSELQSPCNLVCRLLLEKKKPHVAAHPPHLAPAVGRSHVQPDLPPSDRLASCPAKAGVLQRRHRRRTQTRTGAAPRGRP